MSKNIIYVIFVTIVLSVVPIHAGLMETAAVAAEQFQMGFEDSVQQEIEQRSGTIMNRARRFLNRWIPADNQNVDDESGYVTAGRCAGHVIGYAGAWLCAVDQSDEDCFRVMVLRSTGVLIGLYFLRKLTKSGNKKVIHIS